MLRQFWYFQGMIYSKTYSGNKDVRMASIGKAQEQMRKRIQCFLDKSEKQTMNPNVQSGSRITEGLKEAYHFFSLQRIRSIWQTLETENK